MEAQYWTSRNLLWMLTSGYPLFDRFGSSCLCTPVHAHPNYAHVRMHASDCSKLRRAKHQHPDWDSYPLRSRHVDVEALVEEMAIGQPRP